MFLRSRISGNQSPTAHSPPSSEWTRRAKLYRQPIRRVDTRGHSQRCMGRKLGRDWRRVEWAYICRSSRPNCIPVSTRDDGLLVLVGKQLQQFIGVQSCMDIHGRILTRHSGCSQSLVCLCTFEGQEPLAVRSMTLQSTTFLFSNISFPA